MLGYEDFDPAIEQEIALEELEQDANKADDDKGGSGDELELDGKELSKSEETALAGAALLDFATMDELREAAYSTEAMADISDIMGVAMEKTIVKFDRNSRMKHLLKTAEFTAARNANAPEYKKLMKIWKLERALELKIHQRFGTKAKAIARQQIKNYAANGKKKKMNLVKPNPSTTAYKDKVQHKVAARAIAQAKGKFSGKKSPLADRKGKF